MADKMSTIARIMNDFDRSLKILFITRPSDGYSDSVYFIACCDENRVEQEFVLKFIPPNGSAEVHFYQLIHQSMIDRLPVPKLIKYDLSVEQFYLASKLPGIPLSQAFSALTSEERLAIYQQFGNVVGQMHATHSYDRCGYLEGTTFSSWRSMFEDITDSQVKRFEGTYFQTLAEDMKKYLFSHMQWIDQGVVPRLLHMDLHCGNILVENGKITGILDAEEAMVGHNEYELMRIEKGHFEEDSPDDQMYREIFISNYQNHVSLDDDYQKRRPFYSLSRELVGMRCLLDYGERYAQSGSVEDDRIKLDIKIRDLLISR